MGYEKSKIYKLQCDDGHYYYGSTRSELSRRLYDHKHASLNQAYRVYEHIKTIGWERVTMILIEEFPCSDRKELLKRENMYIMEHLSDPLCLNTICASITEDERREKHRRLNEKYKDKLAEYHKEKRTGNPEVAEYQRQYREKNKEKIKENKKAYYGKTKEHDNQRSLERYYANREEILKRKREKYKEKTNQTS